MQVERKNAVLEMPAFETPLEATPARPDPLVVPELKPDPKLALVVNGPTATTALAVHRDTSTLFDSRLGHVVWAEVLETSFGNRRAVRDALAAWGALTPETRAAVGRDFTLALRRAVEVTTRSMDTLKPLMKRTGLTPQAFTMQIEAGREAMHDQAAVTREATAFLEREASSPSFSQAVANHVPRFTLFRRKPQTQDGVDPQLLLVLSNDVTKQALLDDLLAFVIKATDLNGATLLHLLQNVPCGESYGWEGNSTASRAFDQRLSTFGIHQGGYDHKFFELDIAIASDALAKGRPIDDFSTLERIKMTTGKLCRASGEYTKYASKYKNEVERLLMAQVNALFKGNGRSVLTNDAEPALD